jgi:anti-sigma regulatory factor (Ser/Thr protein kinase)
MEAVRRIRPREQLELKDEHDARRARMLAREMAMATGTPKLHALRAASCLDELTSNILRHARAGRVSIEILDAPSRIRVTAKDRGPGIRDDVQLDDPEQARGLLHVQKLADHFRIDTSRHGTTVEFEMHL